MTQNIKQYYYSSVNNQAFDGEFGKTSYPGNPRTRVHPACRMFQKRLVLSS